MIKTLYLLLFTSLSMHAAFAAVSVPKPTTQKNLPVKKTDLIKEEIIAPPTMLDNTHEMVGTRLVGLADQLDSLFGDKRTDDESNKSVLRLSTSATYSEFYRPKQDYQIRMNIKLPRLEKFFKYSFQNKEDKKVSKPDGTDKVAKAPVASATVTPPAKPEIEKGWIFRTDLGLNIGPPPKVFARGRLRRNMTTGSFIHRLSEESGWYSERGFASVTILNSDYDIADTWLFRFSNEKDWNITTKDFNLSHGPSITHSLSDKSAISYNLRMLIPVINSIPYVSTYVLSIGYRKNIYSNWLFAETSPALSFPKERSFQRVPSILFKLEAYFGTI